VIVNINYKLLISESGQLLADECTPNEEKFY